MPVSKKLIPGYQLRAGSTLERALLLKFLQRTYKEVYPKQDFAHLAITVDQYLSHETPIWWVEIAEQDPPLKKGESKSINFSNDRDDCGSSPLPFASQVSPVGCLWVGNVVDQVKGDRHGHIFMVYVAPKHRRRGIGSALVRHAANWAKQRGDRQITLQVFLNNEPAVNLYEKLGYQPYSLLMQKPLN